jgi:putative transposase
MSNHWHLLLKPRTDAALSKFMAWMTVTHARRLHQHYKAPGSGHVYQGRFKSFPVEQDEHFLTVARYIEANAKRAGMVDDARAWPWGSAAQRERREEEVALAEWPVNRPRGWVGLLNEPIPPEPLSAIHESVNRGRPYGSPAWVKPLAIRLGLESSLKRRGRPEKAMKGLSARQLRRRKMKTDEDIN